MNRFSQYKGLTTEEAEERLDKFGPNEIASSRHLSAVVEFLVKFKNPLIFILLSAALVNFFLGDKVSSLIIIVIVILSVVLDFVNTYRSQQAVEALQRRVMITATVIRDAQEQELPLAMLVPDDVVIVSPGDIIPADGSVLYAKDFFVNESSLTGESFPIEKMVEDGVFMGASVVTGSGLMKVIQTGKKTRFGSIAITLSKRETPTDFDRGIKDFSFLIMRITFLLVIFIFLTDTLLKHSILESFLFAAALAVGLTPELLPMIIALNLSKGSLAMSRKGVIVKKLSAIQNFGSMDILCTDKTGTLTEDKIVLVKYVNGSGESSDDVLFYSYLNSAHRSGHKNPLDTAIREFRKIDISAYKKIDEIPFDYARKRDSVVVEKVDSGERILISKGAPEEILKACTFYEGAKGPLEGKILEDIYTAYYALSREGFRVLGVAMKKIDERKDVYSRDIEEGMTFHGFVAFLDPPKNSAKETVRLLAKYGVEIKILTGDNDLVSKRIAEEINLPVKGILTGVEIAEMTDETLRFRAQDTTIFARVLPDQKRRIIDMLRGAGHVVGYLGDGINDAPSLKEADVGISVDNAVDVAKESADLILLHKSLRELIDGVIEGRKTFLNTLKYLMMALSSNFGNMFSMAAASLFLPFLPMLPVQILFNNLLYDTSQFTLPLDSTDDDRVILPEKWNIGLLRKFMLVFGPLSSFFDFLTFAALYWVFHLSGSEFQTGWFLESIATQTLVIYIIRTRKIPFVQSSPSPSLVASTVAAVVFGWFVAQGKLAFLLHFTPLSLPVLIAIVVIVALYGITVELVKRPFYRRFWQ